MARLPEMTSDISRLVPPSVVIVSLFHCFDLAVCTDRYTVTDTDKDAEKMTTPILFCVLYLISINITIGLPY